MWTDDPKRTVFRDAAKRTLTAGYKGSVGEKAAAGLADFIVLDMSANYATGHLGLKNPSPRPNIRPSASTARNAPAGDGRSAPGRIALHDMKRDPHGGHGSSRTG